MVTALYRRYRPETFAEMIGQTQVTEPLMTALRTNRVNHAYLFSGPRGCGKTTSARILARCLNCAEGPTDTPCGKCESCIELGRGGQGSLDVVEIDAASHNGVDDARDIRERAIFAPARDRYKIFILDEAHMVTPQGFNALLKIVEEPPEHVKFIFATTEPDKVIGTIRSRTHHYPFRLVPPAQMLDYVQQLCESEGMSVAPGVLPLVVRAGGGSPRDTLSLLDQLIAGSEGETIEYERAVALLGYTHAALLDEVVDAIGAQDAASAFAAVDRVIQTGQDPRRFVEDLLERLRDLIIVAATSPDAAAAVLRGTPQEELDRMAVQASVFGTAELSRSADIANDALSEMTGATSPRLHLELMIARMLVPASDATDRGALARVERLERRVGVEGVADRATVAAIPAASAPAAPTSAAPAPAAPAPAPAAEPVSSSVAQAAAFAAAAAAKKGPQAGGGAAGGGAAGGAAASGWATPGVTDPGEPSASTPPAPPAATPPTPAVPVPAPVPAVQGASTTAPVTTQQLRDAWPEILEEVEDTSRNAWAVVYTATVRSLDGDVLSLAFPSANDVESFKGAPGTTGPAEVLRQAIVELLGVRVKFIAKPVGGDGPGGRPGASGSPGGAPSGGAARGDARGAAPRADRSTPSVGASVPASVPAPPRSAAPASSRASAQASYSGATWAAVAIPGGGTAVLERDDVPAPKSARAAGPAVATPAGAPAVEAIPEPAPGPVDFAPADSIPVDSAPVDSAPVDSAPVDSGLGDSAPVDSEGWYVPTDDDEPIDLDTVPPEPEISKSRPQPVVSPPVSAAQASGRSKAAATSREPTRYGEAVVRELLGAKFIEEQRVEPRQGGQPGFSR